MGGKWHKSAYRVILGVDLDSSFGSAKWHICRGITHLHHSNSGRKDTKICTWVYTWNRQKNMPKNEWMSRDIWRFEAHFFRRKKNKQKFFVLIIYPVLNLHLHLLTICFFRHCSDFRMHFSGFTACECTVFLQNFCSSRLNNAGTFTFTYQQQHICKSSVRPRLWPHPQTHLCCTGYLRGTDGKNFEYIP